MHSCTGPMPNMCTPEHDYGGCWHSKTGGEVVHACVDNMHEYRSLSAFGRLNETVQPFRCQCPPCWRPTGPDNAGCERVCDSDHCDKLHGTCFPNAPASGASRGEAPWLFRGSQRCPLTRAPCLPCLCDDADGSTAQGSAAAAAAHAPTHLTPCAFLTNTGGGSILLGVTLSMAATLGAVYGLYQMLIRRRMEADMRTILEEYVPLNSAPTNPQPLSALQLFSAPSADPSEERMWASSRSSGSSHSSISGPGSV